MRSLKGKTVLVTGGAGFIGSHLADALFGTEVKNVVIIDNFFTGNEKNVESFLSKGGILYRDDAELHTSLDYIFENHTIDTVFNCATKALNYSFLNPKNAFETNTRIAINLLELQRKGAFGSLCHFSTSEVYGTAVYEPMDEKHPVNPTTAYAGGKAAADIAVGTYQRMYDVDAFIVRPFNNYGPRQNFAGFLAGVIPITIRRILSGEAPIIQGSGKQSRDFIFVHDTVAAVVGLYKLMEAGESINVSSGAQLSIEELITMICDCMGYHGDIQKEPERGSDVFCHNSSNAKLLEALDLRFTPFSEGLNTTIEWYKKEMSS